MIELLVVVSVIALLMGILLPALNAARRTAKRTEELASARDLMVAWNFYADEHNGKVLPGYRDDLPAYDLNGNDLLASGGGNILTRRYPWRLIPYMGRDFRSLYRNEMRQKLEEFEYQGDETFNYIVSLSPSLGLNSTFVGGDQNELGFSQTALNTFGPFYVTRRSQVRFTERLMVFGSARGQDTVTNSGVVEGFFRIQSPILAEAGGERWAPEWQSNLAPGEFGHVSLRHNTKAVAAFVDGHCESVGERQLRDMRTWSHQATRADWGLTPR